MFYDGAKCRIGDFRLKEFLSAPGPLVVFVLSGLLVNGCLFGTEKTVPSRESKVIGTWRSATSESDSSSRFIAVSNGQITTYLKRGNCFIKYRQENCAVSGDALVAFADTSYRAILNAGGDTLTLLADKAGDKTAYVRDSTMIQSQMSADLTLRHDLSVSKYPDSSEEIGYGDSIQFIVGYKLDSASIAGYGYSLSVYSDEDPGNDVPIRSVDLKNGKGTIVFGFNTASFPRPESLLKDGLPIRIAIEAYDCNHDRIITGAKFEKKYAFRNIGNSGFSFFDTRDYKVYQRDVPRKSASVKIMGEADSTIKNLRVRAILDSTGDAATDWKDMDISNRGMADSVRLPQGGWYRFQYELTKASGSKEMLISHKFGVGMNILCIGQSNMSGRGERAYREVPDIMALYRNDSGWTHLTDPFDGGGFPGQIDYDGRNPRYSMIPELVTELSVLGFPIGIVPACKGSSSMYDHVMMLPWSAMTWSFRNVLNPKDINTLYGNSLAKIDSVGGIELIIMAQGEKDVGIGYSNYKTAFEQMISNYRMDVSDSLPIFFAQIGNTAIPPDSADYLEIQAAQRDVADGRKTILAARAMDLDILLSDVPHYSSESLDSLGSRFAQSILRYLLD